MSAAHRWMGPVAPEAEQCECALCLRHDEAMVRHERALTEPVEMLLDADWAPDEIVNVVATGSPKSSRASMLVRITLVSVAVRWSDEPSSSTRLQQVRALGRRTGFTVESIGPGWFEDWLNIGTRDLRKAQLWTRHALSVLQPIIEFGDLGVTAESQSKFFIGRPRRDEIVRTSSRFMPEPGDQRWRYASQLW